MLVYQIKWSMYCIVLVNGFIGQRAINVCYHTCSIHLSLFIKSPDLELFCLLFTLCRVFFFLSVKAPYEFMIGEIPGQSDLSDVIDAAKGHLSGFRPEVGGEGRGGALRVTCLPRVLCNPIKAAF